VCAVARGTYSHRRRHNKRIEVGLFNAEPGRDAFDAKNVIVIERRPIRSGKQVLKS
jgi:ABC-2 type transport system permease protein